MDIVKEKWKKNLIVKAWRRCKSLGAIHTKSHVINNSNKSSHHSYLKRSLTAPPPEKGIGRRWRQSSTTQVAPDGCFSVYVGPQKQRFAVKAEFANHPLFQMLLEDAETEYGYNSQGPILLPCDADLFYKVLAEMESSAEDGGGGGGDGVMSSCTSTSPSCGFAILRSPNNGGRHGYRGYRLLSPSRLLKINQF